MLSACHCRSITSDRLWDMRHLYVECDRLACQGLDLQEVEQLLMEEILYQLRLVVYPSIHKALSISNGAGFLPPTVWKTWKSKRFTTCSNNNQLWLIARFYPILPKFALDVMPKKTTVQPFLYRAMVTVRPHQILEISLLPLLWALHKYLHGVQSMSGKCLDATLSI